MIPNKNAVPGNGIERPIQETAVSPSSKKEDNHIMPQGTTFWTRGFNAMVSAIARQTKELEAIHGEVTLLREELTKSTARLTALEKHASDQKEDVRSILGNVANLDTNVKQIDTKLFTVVYIASHEGLPIYPADHSVPGIPEEVDHEQSA